MSFEDVFEPFCAHAPIPLLIHPSMRHVCLSLRKEAALSIRSRASEVRNHRLLLSTFFEWKKESGRRKRRKIVSSWMRRQDAREAILVFTV